MILQTKEDFENAILSGKEIKHSTVFYTGELAESKSVPQFGEVNKDGFVYIGTFKGVQLWIYKFDAPTTQSFDNAQAYAQRYRCHIPTIAQLGFTHLCKDEINAAVKLVGGEPFKENIPYWSSSECGSDRSWALHMPTGGSCTHFKSNHYFVRTFQLIEN